MKFLALASCRKKIENHAAAVALWFTYYNFCRVHSTLRVTPAMEAGISNHVWSIEEIVWVASEADFLFASGRK